MENHHFKWVNQLFLWPFSIANCLFTRGYWWSKTLGRSFFRSSVIMPAYLDINTLMKSRMKWGGFYGIHIHLATSKGTHMSSNKTKNCFGFIYKQEKIKPRNYRSHSLRNFGLVNISQRFNIQLNVHLKAVRSLNWDRIHWKSSPASLW